MINLCDHSVSSKIKCDALSMEGHEVTNLLNNSNKGFLAYMISRPPIYIDITFPCLAELKHIKIWPSVGSQKSTGFVLYARDSFNGSYNKISSAQLRHIDHGVLFTSRNADPNDERIVEVKDFMKCLMTEAKYRNLMTNSIRLKIYKAERLVALGKIEIWGVPQSEGHIFRLPEERETHETSIFPLPLYYLENNSKPPSIAEPSRTTEPTAEPSIRSKENGQSNSQLDIPKRFLDPITCEIMTQPILLPSGSVIDQSTLEKFADNEANWGRPMSDPFTGVPFNEHSKPIFAIALKAMIDKFLLINCDSEEIKNLPRVLGYNPSSCLVRDRRIIQVPQLVLNQSSFSTRENVRSDTREAPSTNIPKVVQPNISCRHRLPQIVPDFKKTDRLRLEIFNVKNEKSLKRVYDKAFESNKNNEAKILTVNENINNNENSVVESSFRQEFCSSNIKRFIKSESVELHKVAVNSCKCCNNSILYKLPCKHVICRKELLSKNYQCMFCGVFYLKSQVERFHGYVTNY